MKLERLQRTPDLVTFLVNAHKTRNLVKVSYEIGNETILVVLMLLEYLTLKKFYTQNFILIIEQQHFPVSHNFRLYCDPYLQEI